MKQVYSHIVEKKILICALLALSVASATAKAQSAFAVFDAPNASYTISNAINNSGYVAGYFGDLTQNNKSRGFLRDAQGNFVVFDAPNASSTIVNAINSAGDLTGWFSDVQQGNKTRGFVRLQQGSFAVFDAASNTSFYGTVATSINDNDYVTGYFHDINQQMHGFVRDLWGNTVLFDAPNAVGTAGLGINNSGYVTGFFHATNQQTHAFVRDQSGNITVFDAPGASATSGDSINNNNYVAGYFDDAGLGNQPQAFVRSATGNVTASYFPGVSDVANIETFANNINNNGAITGYFIEANWYRGFVQDASGNTTVFDAPNASASFSGTFATGISDTGAITGYFSDAALQDKFRSFLRASNGSVVPPPAALASGNACSGTYSGAFAGNITVSNGQVCSFIGGSINGNVQLNAGGRLILRNVASINGNVQVNGGGLFCIQSTSISGNLQVQNIPASPGVQNEVLDSIVNGDLQFQNNATAVDISGNTIGGNLQISNNVAPVEVSGNFVKNSLQCQSNSSIMGAGNTAGQKQGQCAGY